MNSVKQSRSGNALIYILLALALLGGLTMVLAKGNDTGGDDLTKDKAELLATQLTAYAGSAKSVVDQMLMSGTPVASLNFILPSDPNFNVGVNIHKVYHPAGGGLNYKTADPNMFDTKTDPAQGWYIGRFNNVQWTPTSAFDVLLAAYGIKKSICEAINKKLTGSTAIPVFPNGYVRMTLVDEIYHSLGANSPLTTTECATCDGKPSLCVANFSQDTYIYYNIISGQ